MMEALRVKDAPKTKSLSQGSEAWNKAVRYVKNGGAIEDILKKYPLSESDQAKLIEDANRI